MTCGIWRVFTLAILLCGQAQGQADADSRALGDHPLVARFPDSQIEEIEIEENANYRLVLGTPQRTRSQVVPEESRRLRGDVTRILYQVAQQFSGEEVFEYFVDQFSAKGYVELFRCSGRACGSSDDWANDIFGNRILYGPVRNQFFMALRVGDAEQASAHLSLYVITRANRRLYAYLEIVEDDVSRTAVEIASPALLETLNARGSVVLPDVAFSGDSQLAEQTELEPILELLRSAPNRNFYLVAHLAGEGDLDDLLARSTVRAETLKRALVQAGVAPSRLLARGLGPLAPACEFADCAERVELVLR